ncbi:MAG: 2-amino-4-hydroxy-6-hydroxymethyldihydropteridine diphosphokinase [Pseudomonadota bacterium]|nr:2-amino-4-hydroxy-6-hydroxymethyldihydropteridine diphosphokinase [Pseudomonadota bacterium]MEE3071554.1 2-amino-4-hydroxy-6-hydroxymethyldihydropteridine diphosphokinase [Pseudomonadota bacterium]
MKKYRQILVAMGGNSSANIISLVQIQRKALDSLAEQDIFAQTVSRFYTNPAFPAGNGNDYVNSVVEMVSDKPEVELLDALHMVEGEFGRTREGRWAPRSLDLDLLSVGGEIAPNREIWDDWYSLSLERQMAESPEQLILPHPRMQDRAFVLVPLCDVAPDWVHPVLGRSARELCESLPAKDRESVVPIPETRVVNFSQGV